MRGIRSAGVGVTSSSEPLDIGDRKELILDPLTEQEAVFSGALFLLPPLFVGQAGFKVGAEPRLALNF